MKLAKSQLQQARAIEWAEYVLPIWEKYYPEDDRPRKAIEAATNTAAHAAVDAASHTAAHAAADAASHTAAAADHASAARAAARAARAAADDASATYAASVFAAAAAAQAILLERYGEDIIKVRKVLLLKEFIDFDNIKWIDYKPEQFWDVMLETYCENK